ncbi:MAG TPA: zf-HC2 domain-containing protein [Syntrophobacteria bacterium]|nr:zf-HC2 domain-containing protein [Syntrophobacteria bacterium]
MKCGAVQERLSAYVDKELEPTLQRSVRQHLDGCVRCREELADLEAIDAEVQALPQVGMGLEFAEAVTVKVCKDFLARDGSPVGRTGPFGRLTNLLEAVFELLEASGSPRTRTLDEFSDFPPLSMGHVYCRLLGLCTGD